MAQPLIELKATARHGLDRAAAGTAAPAAPIARTAPTPPPSPAGRPVDAATTDTSRIDLPR